MDELDRLQNILMQEWETTEREDKCLREYQTEMEQLLQEKMSHVEELRLIHADINMVGLFAQVYTTTKTIIFIKQMNANDHFHITNLYFFAISFQLVIFIQNER